MINHKPVRKTNSEMKKAENNTKAHSCLMHVKGKRKSKISKELIDM